MAGKREEKRAALQLALVEAAEAQIAAEGLASVKARDLAREAGCALGAIYNAYEDLNALFMAVNGRTFQALGAVVTEAVEGSQGAGPHERLIAMSNAYLQFASDNPMLWRALFDLKMSADSPVPDWYLAALDGLFANITKPLSEIFPDMDEEELGLMTRALFSSVHGIVLLGLEQRISGVPVDQIRRMIAQILSQIGNPV